MPKGLCTIANCERPTKGRGYCSKHWYRWRYNGSPYIVKANCGEGDTPVDKFWSKVKKVESGCWEWQGSKNEGRNGAGGYGVFQYAKKRWLTHRFSWFLAHGQDSPMHVLHSCDNRRCVNPGHLIEGTHQDNMDDMVSKGRNTFGERVPQAKLTAEQVQEIRTLLDRGVTGKKLAQEYSISRASISLIKNRINWSHI